MIICGICGQENPLGGKYCNNCGGLLSGTTGNGGGQGMSGIPNSELTPGTVLRDRYVIARLLGRGGFGRVYLAEDIEKFNEKVILKEFTPAVQGTYALQRSETLFQQEAAILYKLQHPQIPKFGGIFRNDNRLFLVQEFIEGLTYSHLLEQRFPAADFFSETEILELFRQILPVLTYLHSQDVIHRDISPDNIIRRQKDKLPVLIDFGAVKQVAIQIATQLSNVDIGNSPGTRIGKVGYAPDEQLGKGIVAPHSDLYALAACSLYLMTGKQPTELWDAHTAQWIWQNELNLSPKLTEALNRMLANAPGQRFQSADEVRQFLDEEIINLPPTNIINIPNSGIPNSGLPNSDIPNSQMRTSLNIPHKPWVLIAGVGAAAVAAIAIAFIVPNLKSSHTSGTDTKTSTPTPTNIVPVPALGKRTLTLGILAIPSFSKEDYQRLADYLKTELGKKIKNDKVAITVDIVETQNKTSLLEAKNRIAEKKWDIAFTLTPMLSVVAKDNGYNFAARMWPDRQQVESVLFVRADSSIKSIADLTPDKTIALGQFSDAVTFYQPLYDLYGKTLKLDIKNSVGDIRDKVESGKADVGAGYLNSVQKNPKLRILGISRAIPLSGVYLSPTLPKNEQDLIKEALLNTDPDLRKKTNYDQGQEPDYNNFIGITKRVNEILSCTDLDKNPVSLYCTANQTATPPTGNIIEGKVNGYTVGEDDKYKLILQKSGQGQLYMVILPRRILHQIPNINSAPELNNKIVQVIDVKPKEKVEPMELEITDIKQIKIKN